MTVHGVVAAAGARRLNESENLTRLAYRIARLSRVSHKAFPKTEAALFKDGARPKRQSMADQYAAAKLITRVMTSRSKH